MGRILIALVVSISFMCCGPIENDPNCGEWILGYTNNSNWTNHVMIVDSFEMKSVGHAIVWIDGKERNVYAQTFYPMYQPCK